MQKHTWLHLGARLFLALLGALPLHTHTSSCLLEFGWSWRTHRHTPIPTLDCLHYTNHTILFHAYRSISLICIQRYTELSYLFHQCGTTRDGRIAFWMWDILAWSACFLVLCLKLNSIKHCDQIVSGGASTGLRENEASRSTSLRGPWISKSVRSPTHLSDNARHSQTANHPFIGDNNDSDDSDVDVDTYKTSLAHLQNQYKMHDTSALSGPPHDITTGKLAAVCNPVNCSGNRRGYYHHSEYLVPCFPDFCSWGYLSAITSLSRHLHLLFFLVFYSKAFPRYIPALIEYGWGTTV